MKSSSKGSSKVLTSKISKGDGASRKKIVEKKMQARYTSYKPASPMKICLSQVECATNEGVS